MGSGGVGWVGAGGVAVDLWGFRVSQTEQRCTVFGLRLDCGLVDSVSSVGGGRLHQSGTGNGQRLVRREAWMDQRERVEENITA